MTGADPAPREEPQVAALSTERLSMEGASEHGQSYHHRLSTPVESRTGGLLLAHGGGPQHAQSKEAT
jgi:hypothetical protein